MWSSCSSARMGCTAYAKHGNHANGLMISMHAGPPGGDGENSKDARNHAQERTHLRKSVVARSCGSDVQIPGQDADVPCALPAQGQARPPFFHAKHHEPCVAVALGDERQGVPEYFQLQSLLPLSCKSPYCTDGDKGCMSASLMWGSTASISKCFQKCVTAPAHHERADSYGRISLHNLTSYLIRCRESFSMH